MLDFCSLKEGDGDDGWTSSSLTPEERNILIFLFYAFM